MMAPTLEESLNDVRAYFHQFVKAENEDELDQITKRIEDQKAKIRHLVRGLHNLNESTIYEMNSHPEQIRSLCGGFSELHQSCTILCDMYRRSSVGSLIGPLLENLDVEIDQLKETINDISRYNEPVRNKRIFDAFNRMSA